jgi:predicted small metal-binding protein
MANVLRCRDVGLDCEGEIRAETEEEVIRTSFVTASKVSGVSLRSTAAKRSGMDNDGPFPAVTACSV